MCLTVSFVEDLEWLQNFVVDAFDDPHFGPGQVFERPKVERHAPELVCDFGVQVARVLHFEQVSVSGLFVDGHLGVSLAAVALAGRYQNVDGVNLMRLELVLFVLFALGVLKT